MSLKQGDRKSPKSSTASNNEEVNIKYTTMLLLKMNILL